MHIAYLTPENPHKRTGKDAGIGSYIKNIATSLSFNQIEGVDKQKIIELINIKN